MVLRQCRHLTNRLEKCIACKQSIDIIQTVVQVYFIFTPVMYGKFEAIFSISKIETCLWNLDQPLTKFYIDAFDQYGVVGLQDS